MQVVRSALLLHSAESMFELIEHAERYPEFLPFCTDVTIVSRSPELLQSRVGFGFSSLRTHLDSRATLQRPHAIDLELAGWPFDRFSGHWQLSPLGAGRCKIEFRAVCAIGDPIWDRLLQFAAGLIADRLVRAFVKRAQRLGL